jgi:hypothetical protein
MRRQLILEGTAARLEEIRSEVTGQNASNRWYAPATSSAA